MKYFLGILFLFIDISCSDQAKKKTGDSKTLEALSHYDTSKFNATQTPDTTGCSWIIADREILESLILEKTVIKTTSDTFLSTTKYKRFWTCNIPSFLLIPNDTILISGNIYRLYSFDHGMGYPTIITKIIYSKR